MKQSSSVAVEISDLSVRRGNRLVLDEVALQIPAGQVVGLLGPSGCGKTTLMRSIVGVQIVEGGTVDVFGLPAGSRPLRHRIGYLTQAPSVYRDLTVAENVRYFAQVVGVRRAALEAEIARVIDAVALADRAGQRVSDLSGGQLSRVSLAAALVGEPELLVLDEPTVGLDPALRRDLWDIFRGLADGGTTLLVSSHVMDEAVRCDRLLLMRAGRFLADDTLSAVLHRTGQPDAERAFLHLIDADASQDGTSPHPPDADRGASAHADEAVVDGGVR